MRKRAQQRSRPTMDEPRHIVQQTKPKIEKTITKKNKNWWIAISLIGIFLLVLFFNTYFNLTSGVPINNEAEGFDKFYLSGPDPYYNMRLIEGTYNTGRYPYYSEYDPLLSYPLGANGGRAPLFNMMAMGFSRLLTPFMDEVEAIGYSMQFIPALFGALLVFPVYFIGKELFNRKAAIIGAMFIAIIPIHLGSGHGSAYALFDHDSFNLLLFFLTFLFLIKSIKEKDAMRSTLYAILAGIPLAGLSMTWVEAQYLYVVIAIYAVIQMFIDIFSNKIEFKVLRTSSLILFTGYLISLPVVSSRGGHGFGLSIPLFLAVAITAFGTLYYIFGRKKIPWTLSMPFLFIIGGIGLTFLYFIKDLVASYPFLSPLQRLSVTIFGSGIYGDKVSMTIAEANTYQISHTVMSFGPSIYWLAWGGFVFLFYLYYKDRSRRDYLFIITLFIMNIWLAGTAGRFLNDMVPLIAILGGWIVWMFVDWLDYKQMLRNIKSAGGGFHGLKRGIKVLHLFGIIFIAVLVILPNAFVAFDAAVPSTPKQKEDGNWTSLKGYMFGDDNYRGAFGLGVGKERYWAHAFNWLSQQDTDIEDPAQRPAFISWWDYGFYESALGDHPTVADNFQDGIEPAANFHTSTSENEAVIVLMIRLIQGNRHHNSGVITDEVVQVLENHLGKNNSDKIVKWMGSPETAPSYGKPIWTGEDAEKYSEYTVGQQYARNAVYHDVVDLLLNDTNVDPETNESTALTDEEVTWLYHDIQKSTGYSIRYYGVEGYDKQIFNIFGFLSDKSLLLVNGLEDDFLELQYEGYRVDPNTREKIDGSDFVIPAKDIIEMSEEERQYMAFTGTRQLYKDPYFETMFYKTYIGPAQGESGSKQEYSYQVPCYDMKHFYAEYISDLSKYQYYDTGKASVVIAKYYEGAYINGSVTFLGQPLSTQLVIQKDLTYYEDVSFPIDHDKTYTNDSGNFNLIAGAGNVTLALYRNLGLVPFPLKNLTFNSTTDNNLSIITDDDAMRRADSNYERILDIVIEPGIVEGVAYNDTDDDGVYNESIDELMSGYDVNIFQITSFYTDQTTGEERVELDTENVIQLTTTDDGYFKASELLPGVYRVMLMKDNFILHFNDVTIYEGNNTYDTSNAKKGRLEGTIYYDEDFDSEIDFDEKLSDIDVELVLEYGSTGSQETVATMKTGSDGKYVFDDIVPGVINGFEVNKYVIKASQLPEYESEVEVYPLENATTYENISIELAPVHVSGYTNYNGAGQADISIYFEPDDSKEENTALYTEAISNELGFYEVDITPGYYNVSIEHLEGNTPVYSYTGTLDIARGQAPVVDMNLDMEKISATVSGITTYEGEPIANISIGFSAFVSIGNTAISTTATADENGLYSVELAPGEYNVTVLWDFVEDGKNYSYVYDESLLIETVPSIKTKDIILSKDEKL